MTEILTEVSTKKEKMRANVYLAYSQTSTDPLQPDTPQYTRYEPSYGQNLEKRKNSQILEVVPFLGDAYKVIGSKNKTLLYNAFDMIASACDESLSLAERSNCFDEWKDNLKLLARTADHFASGHRKILGSLIISTKNKDMSDFNIQTLKTFVEATTVLRQPRITKPECERIIKIQAGMKINAVIAMNPDSLDEEKIKSLETMMDSLLEKDNLSDDK